MTDVGGQGMTINVFDGNRKGQKSLEMIIGLVILLVVAAVVISMFLNIFQEPDVGQDAVEMAEIENECESLCGNFRQAGDNPSIMTEYCLSTFVADVTGDGTTNERAGSGYGQYCEDGIKCFNVHDCTIGRQTYDAEGCQEHLCDYYQRVQGDSAGEAETRIADLFAPATDETGIGSCAMTDLTDSAGHPITTWYEDHYLDVECEELSG